MLSLPSSMWASIVMEDDSLVSPRLIGRLLLIFACASREATGSFLMFDWEREGSHAVFMLSFPFCMVPRILQTSIRASWM